MGGVTVHLQKLSVGSESIQTLQDWQDHVVRSRQRKGLSAHHVHIYKPVMRRRI